ncbi:hypothetical protein A1O1_06929 [Capronia coronata CBS 617.96]|uniref:Trichothecene 3-O-acetyltransferase-like N-terminal domain-containing protein n=1 Tax=Capronia coronata CBS 617.96 TaxID=1182541 RepID=W9Y0Z2_9EURO|nr:uncharacterized protein A1O1_06929 [Capronia coronata CBS 617.96]EXJ83310.1 hypothetical protein A1O1_06929 [Capronia coronata CBS 617.96]
MDKIRDAGFPMSMLAEKVICPRNTLAAKTAVGNDPAPVFIVQANFITGGLLLAFVGQHNVMDMTGQGQIIRLLSKACHNEPFTDDKLVVGNQDRRDTIPLLDEPFDPSVELARQLAKPPASIPNAESTSSEAGAKVPMNPHTAPTKCSWACFVFSSTALAALKSLAVSTMTGNTGYMSTDDALSAFIWQSIMRARLHRLDPKEEVTFARAVDPQPFLGIPKTYLGVVQNMTYHTYVL